MNHRKEVTHFNFGENQRGYPFYSLQSPTFQGDDSDHYKKQPSTIKPTKSEESSIFIKAPPAKDEGGDISVVITVPDIEIESGKIKGNYKFRFLLDDLGNDVNEPIEVQLNLEELKHSVVGSNAPCRKKLGETCQNESNTAAIKVLPVAKLSNTNKGQEEFSSSRQDFGTSPELCKKDNEPKCCLLNQAIENVKQMTNKMRLNKSEYLEEEDDGSKCEDSFEADFRNFISHKLLDHKQQTQSSQCNGQLNKQSNFCDINTKLSSSAHHEISDPITRENYLHLTDFIGKQNNQDCELLHSDNFTPNKLTPLPADKIYSKHCVEQAKSDPNIADNYKILSSQINCNKNCHSTVDLNMRHSSDYASEVSNLKPPLTYLKHMTSEYKRRLLRMKTMYDKKLRSSRSTKTSQNFKEYSPNDGSCALSMGTFASPTTKNSESTNQSNKIALNSETTVPSIRDLLGTPINKLHPHLTESNKYASVEKLSSVTIEQIINDYLTRENSKQTLISPFEANDYKTFLISRESQTEHCLHESAPLVAPSNLSIFSETDENMCSEVQKVHSHKHCSLSPDPFCISDKSDCWSSNNRLSKSFKQKKREHSSDSKGSMYEPQSCTNENLNFSISSFRPTSSSFNSEDETFINNKDITFGTPQSVRFVDKFESFDKQGSKVSFKSNFYRKGGQTSTVGTSFIQKELLDIISALKESPELKKSSRVFKFDESCDDGKFIRQFTSIDLPASKSHMRLFRHSASGSLRSWRIRQLESIFNIQFQSSSIVVKEGRKFIRVGIAYFVKPKF